MTQDMDYMDPVGFNGVYAEKELQRNKEILKVVLIILFTLGILAIIF